MSWLIAILFYCGLVLWVRRSHANTLVHRAAIIAWVVFGVCFFQTKEGFQFLTDSVGPQQTITAIVFYFFTLILYVHLLIMARLKTIESRLTWACQQKAAFDADQTNGNNRYLVADDNTKNTECNRTRAVSS